MLTAAGRWFAATSAVLFAVGLVLGYRSLVAVALALFGALLVAVLWVLRRSRVEATRTVEPERVRVGQPARSRLVLRNHARRRTNGGVALEIFGNRILPVELPSLAGGETAEVYHQLPTDRRGVFQVGPLLVDRSDPFGLIRTGQRQQSTARLFVHPLTVTVDPYPSGITRDLDGPYSGEAPEGGIAFQSLREYVEGDDLRLVHWRSFARTDRLMVRHNVDTHQPRSLILLDTRPKVYDADTFESAISSAASVMMASVQRRFPVRLRTSCGISLDASMGATGILDELARLTMSSSGTIDDAVEASRRDPGGLSLTVITGRCAPDDLVSVGPLRTKFAAVTIARIGAKGRSGLTDLPGAVLLNANDVFDFARGWNHRVHR